MLRDPCRSGCQTLGLLLRMVAFAVLAAQVALPGDAIAQQDARVLARRLLDLAQQNQLDDAAAVQAAELLAHGDPFVRGMAEWSLAMRVGHDNNGQQAVWPRADAPAWFDRWQSLPAGTLLEQDWVRQAVSAGLDLQPERLLQSVEAMLARGGRMRGEFARRRADAATDQQIAADLDELRAVRDRLAVQLRDRPEDAAGHAESWLQARRVLRRVTLRNPDLGIERLLLVTRYAPHTPRNITRTFAWQHKPGGGIQTLAGLDPATPLEPLLSDQLGPGHVHSLDLAWNADRVAFSFARQPRWPPERDTTTAAGEGRGAHELRRSHPPLQLFEIQIDGRTLRQLTEDSYWNDFEPAYCADGGLVFASDRCARSAECGPFDYDIANANLFRLAPQNDSPQRLTDSKDLDRHPASLNDGRLVYTHWEYQERHFMEVHSLWTARPDGSMSDALFKQHLKAPLALRAARPVPGSSQLVAIASGHHCFASGPVVRIDPSAGLNNAAAIRVITPGVRPQEGPMAGSPPQEGGVIDAGGLYETPWALSETCFLAAYAYARPKCSAPGGVDSNGFGVYLIDVYGNRELIHRDRLLSTTHPLPIVARRRPLQVADSRPAKRGAIGVQAENAVNADGIEVGAEPANPSAASPPGSAGAVCCVADVYEGLDGIPRGSVRYLRVAQHVGWPLDETSGMAPYFTAAAYEKQFAYRSWSPVRVIGTVPVQADGSVSFRVPADTALYFQLLDERFMEVRRMRSFVSLQHGETRSCRGCHETQAKTPRADWRSPLALKQPPVEPVAPPWGNQRLLGYEWLIQPILDQHCTRCHGPTRADGDLDLGPSRNADGLLQSFATMFGRGSDGQSTGQVLVSVADRFSDSSVSQPKQFGSHRSSLVTTLLEDPLHLREVQLDEDQWYALVTWIDCNAPYYDRFINKRPAPAAGKVTRTDPR